MKWSPSIRAKVIFFSLVCLVLLAFCLTLAALHAVNARKQAIVDNARDLVHMLADQLTTQTAQLRAADEVKDAETLRTNKRFRQMVDFVVSSSDGVLVALRYNYGEQRYEYLIDPKAQQDLRVDLQTHDLPEATEAGRDILFEDQPKAELVVKYVPEVLLARIHEESRQITIELVVLAAGLTFLLGITFIVLWKVFRRHLEREHAYEQIDRMAYVGTLASGLAHEIRNPLNAIGLNLDVVAEEMADPQSDSVERTRKLVGLLKSEVNRLNSTLANFLQFARPAPRRFEMTDVVAILNETASLLAPQMRQSKIHYQFEGERSCVTFADPSALRQIFWNVLLNAIQALEECEERRIEARCRVEGGNMQIQICDTGPGIPSDRRDQVFEAFYSSRSGGSGFGLPIARQLVERMGGIIQVDSLDREGCIISIRLPIRLEKPE